MPALPFTDRGLKIAITGTYGSGVWANILHAQYTAGTPVPVDLNTLAAQFALAWSTLQGPVVSTGVVITQTLVIDTASATGASGVDSTPRSALGAPPAAVANVAMVLSWHIARRYRGGHPRNYLTGIVESAFLDQQHWVHATANAAGTRGNTFIATINALTTPSTGLITFGNWSYFKGHDAAGKPILRPVPVFDRILSCSVDFRIDTLRRRLGKH
jgi:hypothetical protein